MRCSATVTTRPSGPAALHVLEIDIAGHCRPSRVHMSVKRPVGQIESVQRVGQRGFFEPVWRKHSRGIPLAEPIAHLRLGKPGREHRCRCDRIAALSPTGTMEGEPQNSQRCAARDASKTVMAWQLWHLTSRFSKCQSRVSGPAERRASASSCSRIVSPGVSFPGVHGMIVPQYGTDESLLGSAPLGIAAALGAGMLAQRGDLGHGQAGSRNSTAVNARENRRVRPS